MILSESLYGSCDLLMATMSSLSPDDAVPRDINWGEGRFENSDGTSNYLTISPSNHPKSSSVITLSLSLSLSLTLYLVNDGLHVRLVFVVSIEKSRPLLWADSKTCVHRHLYDLTVVFSAKSLVGTEL